MVQTPDTERTAQMEDQYDALLKTSIESALRGARTQLDDLRPFFEAGRIKEIPQRLYQLNGMFSRIDLVLREVEGYLSMADDDGQSTDDETDEPVA